MEYATSSQVLADYVHAFQLLYYILISFLSLVAFFFGSFFVVSHIRSKRDYQV